MPSSSRTRRGVLLLLLAAVAVAGAVAAEDLTISAVTVAFRGRQLTAEAKLLPFLSPETSQRLSSGLPTTTVWEIRLFAARTFWPDGLKDDRRYEVTATYRPVNSDWTLQKRLDGKLLETVTVPTLSEAAEALSRLPAFPVFTMGNHLLGKQLVVKVRCTHGTGISLGVIPTSMDTGWTRSRVFVWNGERP